MTKLPRVSGRDCVDALMRAGFRIRRQHASHIITQIVVPDHKELDRGTLRAILRQADVTIERFVEWLRYPRYHNEA